MHNYLRAIGFDNIHSVLDEEKLVLDVLQHYDSRELAEDDRQQVFVQFRKEYMMFGGISVCGVYDENNLFHMEYYYPYYTGGHSLPCEQIVVEKKAASESYVGGCDDMRIGTTLIFYVNNPVEYIKNRTSLQISDAAAVSLAAMAESGVILFPVEKNASQIARSEKEMKEKQHLYRDAVKGDQEAIESLTMDDIDTYSMLSRRILTEDVYSIVDSYFMPYGLECEIYNIMGDIVACRSSHNAMSGSKIYELSVNANGIVVDICVNEKDLTGVPMEGRRFKGVIWLQGQIAF